MSEQKLTVHYMQYGMTACLENGPPSKWPDHHKWSSDWNDVTCPACIAGKELTVTFHVSEDGKSIKCLRCRRTSHNQNDVDKHYCGCCHVFHDDIWPPARAAWLKTPLIGDRVPASECPTCRNVMDAATGIGTPGAGPKRPEPGDITICLCCGTLLVYDLEMQLVFPPEDIRKQIEADPDYKAFLDTIGKALEKIRPDMQKKYGYPPTAE